VQIAFTILPVRHGVSDSKRVRVSVGVVRTAEGDLQVMCTPGPLEHLHELLLVDVLHRSRGSVRMGVSADGRTLRITVAAERPARIRGAIRGPGSTFLQARAVVTALGGRMEGDHFDAGVTLLIPRR
jgi:hypothetical protein